MLQVGNIDAVLLAAGLSSRMGEANKLLLDFGGQPLVRHTAETLTRAGFGSVTVVTGFEAEAVAACLTGLTVTTTFNPDFADGQRTSVAHGLRTIAAAGREPAGVMICLSDMPYLETQDYRTLAAAFLQNGADRIALPDFAGQRGNPIVVPSRLLAEASRGGLNTGCRRLIERRPGEVDRIPVANAAFVSDIDTPPDYDRALRAAYPGRSCCG